MVKLFVIGNPALPEDSLALRIAEHLKGIRFELLEDPLTLIEIKETVVILDVAEGIAEPQWIHASDSDKLRRERKMISLHDFDIQFVLNMGSALKELPDIWILAIPRESSVEELLPKVESALRASPIPLQGNGWSRKCRGHKP